MTHSTHKTENSTYHTTGEISDPMNSSEPISSSFSGSFLDLPPEIIAKVTQFVDIFNNDLHSLVTICRPSLARFIRNSYLKNNVNYLHYVGSADGRTARWRQGDFDPTVARDKLLQWMEVNDGWAGAHRPSDAIPSVQAEILLQPVDSDSKEAMLDAELINGASHATFESLPPELFRDSNGGVLEEVSIGHVMYGIGLCSDMYLGIPTSLISCMYP